MFSRLVAAPLFIGCAVSVASHALAQEDNALQEADSCREIGFDPQTEAFGECVLTLLARQAGSRSSQPPATALVTPIPATRASAVLTARETSVPAARLSVAPAARLASTPITQVAAAQPPARVVTSPPARAATVPTAATTSRQTQVSGRDATCAQYGFSQGTDDFANCVMQLDQAAQRARQQEQQRAFQQQQLAIQQQALAAEERRRRNREQGDALLGLAQMFLGSPQTNQPSPSIDMTCVPQRYWQNGVWHTTSTRCTSD